MRWILTLSFLLASLAALSACGTRGPLYLPPPQNKTPAPPAQTILNPQPSIIQSNPNTTKDPD